MINLKCPECGQEVNHEQEIVAKRALSLHRWFSHQIRSPKAAREAERKEQKAAALAVGGSAMTWKLKTVADLGPQPTEPKAREKWRKARWRIEHRDKVKAQRDRYYRRKLAGKVGTPVSENDTLTRANLQQSSWWKTEGPATGELQPVKLDRCPCCGTEFYIKKGQ